MAREDWAKLLPPSPLEGNSENHFLVSTDRRSTNVRLNIYPDGGVARLRIRGEAIPDWGSLLAAAAEILQSDAVVWRELLPRTKLTAH